MENKGFSGNGARSRVLAVGRDSSSAVFIGNGSCKNNPRFGILELRDEEGGEQGSENLIPFEDWKDSRKLRGT